MKNLFKKIKEYIDFIQEVIEMRKSQKYISNI